MKLTYKSLQTFSCLLLSLLLFACAAKPTTTLRNPDWERSGKIALQDAQQSASLLYHWQQQGDSYIIHLMNPLGKVELLLKGKNGLVSAQTADGTKHQANNAEDLLLELSGWAFPVRHAQYWLDGQADPEGKDLEVNNDLNLVRFRSGNWLIELGKYKNQKPSLIKATHSNPALRVQLINKHYVRFK